MRRLKRALGLCVLLATGAAVSGCIIVPVPFGHYGGGYHNYRR